MGAHKLGRGTGHHRRQDTQGPQGGSPQRDRLPRGKAGSRNVHELGASFLGDRRPQLSHEHLLLGSPFRIQYLVRLRPTLPGPHQCQVHTPDLRPPGIRPLFQPACTAHHRGQDERRQAGDHGPKAVEHGFDERLLAPFLPGNGGRRAPGHGPDHPAGGTLQPGLPGELDQLGGVPESPSSRHGGHLRELHQGHDRGIQGVHAGVRGRGIRGESGYDPRDRGEDRGGR